MSEEHNPLVRAAAFGGGLFIGWQMEKERQAYKAAGLKPPLSLRIFNGVVMLLGAPILLACVALAAYTVFVGVAFAYAIVVVYIIEPVFGDSAMNWFTEHWSVVACFAVAALWMAWRESRG